MTWLMGMLLSPRARAQETFSMLLDRQDRLCRPSGVCLSLAGSRKTLLASLVSPTIAWA